MNTYASPSRRRGMLLLLTLLMLALFLGIGAMLLTIATRARATARAYAAATQDSLVNDAFIRRALDEALMSALRGSSTGTNGSVLSSGAIYENILADKYGTSAATTGTNLSPASGPLLTLTLSSLPVLGDGTISPASRLNGRVLTINPNAADGDIASFRIIAAFDNGTSGATCYLANLPSITTKRIPAPTKAYPVIINGREFTPVTSSTTTEAFDAYRDDTDAYLAQPVLLKGQLDYFSRVSFAGDVALEDPTTTFPLPGVVDNDNDGVPDGVWISGTSPVPTSPPPPYISGAVIPDCPSPLGGTLRFKVSYLILDLDGRINVNTAGIAAPSAGSYASTPSIPLGMGFGPADLDISLLFPATVPAQSGTSAFTGSGTSSPPGLWTPLLSFGSPASLGSAFPSVNQRRVPPLVGAIHGRYGPNGVPGANVDDSDAYQLTSGSATPGYTTWVTGANTVADLQGRLKIYMTGSSSSPTLNFFSPATVSDYTDDPYESRFDEGAPRFGSSRRNNVQSASQNDDNPFTLGEMERILRANDADANQLPQRLAAGISDYAQRARMTITTDSWDTPAITGTAASQIESFIASFMVHQNQNAWSGSNTVVSPDVAAGLRFNLNRPVSTDAERQEYCKGLYTLAIALDPTLDKDTAAQWAVNALDFRDSDSVFTKFSYDTTLSRSAGWQVPPSPPNEAWGMERPELVIQSITNNSSTGKLDVTLFHPYRASLMQIGSATSTAVELIDTSLGAPPNTLVITSTSTIWQLALSGSAVPITSSTLAPGASLTNSSLAPGIATDVFLQRLADPAKPMDSATNPYVTVDRIAVPVSGKTTTNPPLRWIHWPNRPFISNAELALVPSNKQLATSATTSLALAPSTRFILDATYVPSRFAGNAITTPGMNAVGFDKLKAQQLSKWREPGKVNVNTLVAGATPSDNSDADNATWTILMGGTNVINPFAGKPRTKTRPADPGGPGVPATPATLGAKGKAPCPAQSVAHLLSGTVPSTSGTTAPALGFPPDEMSKDPGNFAAADGSSLNPFFTRSQAIRLANTATIRSQVFAIWITVQITDDSPNGPPPFTKRLFAIVDRSIPVGYLPGQDLNARDCIKIKRYLD